MFTVLSSEDSKLKPTFLHYLILKQIPIQKYWSMHALLSTSDHSKLRPMLLHAAITAVIELSTEDSNSKYDYNNKV